MGLSWVLSHRRARRPKDLVPNVQVGRGRVPRRAVVHNRDSGQGVVRRRRRAGPGGGRRPVRRPAASELGRRSLQPDPRRERRRPQVGQRGGFVVLAAVGLPRPELRAAAGRLAHSRSRDYPQGLSTGIIHRDAQLQSTCARQLDAQKPAVLQLSVVHVPAIGTRAAESQIC